MTKREAKFVGNLYINVSKEGKKYAKGTLDIEGKIVSVFGHIRTAESKNNPGETYTVIHLEDTTEVDQLKKAATSKLADSNKRPKKEFKLDL